MDRQGRPKSVKQTENFNLQKKGSPQANRCSNSVNITPPHRIVLSSPISKSLTVGKSLTPSSIPRIKPASLSTLNRISPTKNLGKYQASSKEFFECEHKKTSSTTNLYSCTPRASQRLFTTERNSIIPKISRFTQLRENYHGQASLTSKAPLRIPNSSYRKNRKSINVDTFLPTSRTNRIKRSCSTVNESRFFGHQLKEDRSEDLDWEFIDWPWVTPYAPLEHITLLSDIKAPDFFSRSGLQHYLSYSWWNPIVQLIPINSVCDKNERTPTPLSKNYEAFNQKRSSCQLTLDLNGKCKKEENYTTKSRSNHKRLSLSQRFHVISEPIPQNSSWDQEVISFSPIHRSQGQSLSSPVNQQTECSMKTDGEMSRLENILENINNFTKNVAKMRKEDQFLIERLLEAIKNVRSNDSSLDEQQKHMDESLKENGCKFIDKNLNPNVPDFQPKVNCVSEKFLEIEKKLSQETINHDRLPLQEIKPPNQDRENTENKTAQLRPQIPHPKNRLSRLGIHTTKPSRKSTSSGIYSNKTSFIEDKLMESCLNKIYMLELEDKQRSMKCNELSRIPCNPLDFSDIPFTQGNQIPYIEIDEDGPGRVANAMEHSWASQMLEKFRGKYPMTGAIKSDLVSNVKKKIGLRYSATSRVFITFKKRKQKQTKLLLFRIWARRLVE